ncbi:MAG: polymer-forming cytoskeletal protein [Proteobacteria bacterium]|nr:polymer-forming cytoskeletal protein [Pseudomonadota bacterium]
MPPEDLSPSRAPSRAPSRDPSPGPGVPSIISADLKIVGDLHSNGDLQIDGAVEGDITSRSVTVGEGAVVRGSLVAENVRVYGAVFGQIKANSVTLAKTAKVEGNIVHQALSMEAGAFGLSTGLEYPPERNAGDIEIETLCRTVAEYGGIYAPHTRNREVAAVEAVDEVLRNARNSGVALHISHLSPRRGGPPDAREQILELVGRAAAAGEDVTFDTHTRLHGITNLSNAVPSEHFTGDAAGLLEVLADPASRRAFAKDENIITSFGLGGWENVVIFNAPMSPDLEGRSITEIAGGENPFDVIFDVLAQHAGDPHSILVTCKSYEDAEVIDTARQPLCMVGSDATALCNDGPLAGKVFLGAYTWAGWYLRQTVREFGVFTVEEAVRRMTAMPADRIGLGLRGRLVVGAPADIAVFDPDSIADQGTLEQPNRLAKGIRHTIVNGVPAFVDGSFTETRNGQILRRAG